MIRVAVTAAITLTVIACKGRDRDRTATEPPAPRPVSAPPAPRANPLLTGTPLAAEPGSPQPTDELSADERAVWVGKAWVRVTGPHHDEVLVADGVSTRFGAASTILRRYDDAAVLESTLEPGAQGLATGTYAIVRGKPVAAGARFTADRALATAAVGPDELLKGFARGPHGLIVVLKPTDAAWNHASIDERARAVSSGNLAGLASEGGGAMIVIDAAGQRREPLPARPYDVATLADGTTIVVTEGTASRLFTDGMILARAPTETTWRVLATELDTLGRVVTRGDWLCLTAMRGAGAEDAALHCLSPARNRHLSTTYSGARVWIADIAPGARVVYKVSHAGGDDQVFVLRLE